MRGALLVVAGLALIGYVAVAFVLPRMAGAEMRRRPAQALVAGAEPPKQQVGSAAEKIRQPRRRRQRRQGRSRRTIPSTAR